LAYALGAIASASGVNSTALGSFANAEGVSSLALGSGADALADFSGAIGVGSIASHAASFALGTGSATTRINQIVIGQDGSGFGATGPVTVTIPGLPTAASNAAQSGSLFFVTVDGAGNLGFSTMSGGSSALAAQPISVAAAPNTSVPLSSIEPSTPSVAAAPQSGSSDIQITATSLDGGPALATGEGVAIADASRGTREQPVQVARLDETQNVPEPPAEPDADAGTRQVATASFSQSVSLSPSNTPAISQVTQTQFDQLSNRVGAVEGRLDLVEGQLEVLSDEIASSTAVAVAMGGTTFLPDQNFSLSANIGTYDGAHAGSFNIGALVSENVAVNAGVATGFNRNGKTAGRVGVTIGF